MRSLEHAGGFCLWISTYRISVRFLMALVQWCSGYVSFQFWGGAIESP